MIGFLKRLLFKELVTVDKFGNRYYQQSNIRWVAYKGINEPSKILPQYYLWLHHSTNKIEKIPEHTWEKDRIPNLTGTEGAYLSDRHILKNPFATEEREYIPWEPKHE